MPASRTSTLLVAVLGVSYLLTKVLIKIKSPSVLYIVKLLLFVPYCLSKYSLRSVLLRASLVYS